MTGTAGDDGARARTADGGAAGDGDGRVETVDGTVILEGVVGSVAYGLATGGSDVDLLGVYQAPTHRVLGLDGPAVTSASRVTTGPDRTLHELGKYATLALRSNPTVLELLWLPEYRVCTPAGAALLAVRDAFPSSAAVRRAYLGYAHQQATKLVARHRAAGGAGRAGAPADGAEPDEAGGEAAGGELAGGGAAGVRRRRIEKHGRHCLRLLRQGRHLLATGEVLIDVGDAREEIFAAGRLAAEDPEGYLELFERERERLEGVRSVLPEHPDRRRVDALVVALRGAG
ncbi:nucleotidyltransferase domain-containing protein [Allostreptomyces psammosilenae]|uniref:Nucleotidyltransferase n=1 Tax=Allostreptomyces psammosilenae TaxID=1892865 RepID=A0A852ZNC9_9ACTN|nr:nucleotidyltransferase domain-containing protein [Allostreptomyces psammosilenae]NYI03175.1 hypothetical protein [Allostreptomyces psammosilenae]